MSPAADPAAPRHTAWLVLRDVAGGAHADRSAERRFEKLSTRDRRLAMELAYGCVRLRARLDHELGALVDRPLQRVDPGVLDWLRLGLYQLRELRVPDHAAVDRSVEGARRTEGRGAAGFVNGVLRAATRVEDRSALFPDPEDEPLEHLATWGSHPRWLLRRWAVRWPLGRVRELVELDNRPPPVTVRLLGPDPGAGRRAAREAGVELEPLPGWPRCAALVRGDPTPLLERVPAVVQDPAASAVVDYVGTIPDGPVLDACAAPGGKAVALADARPRARPLVAGDVHVERLRRTLEAARRVGVPVRCVAMDARAPATGRTGLVLVDAPCTGTGTLRRRPDARWRVGPERLASLRRLQREILDACADRVARGGLLVYATCSLEPEENEEQVEAFLDRHPEFVRSRPEPGGDLPVDVLDEAGDLRVLPWRRGTDGAYAARLRREPR